MTYHPSQGRISKRYNRRVRYAHVTRRLKLRIAELEAELAETKDKLETANQQILIDAKLREKAEAEVERLSQFEIATDNYGRPIKRGGGRESHTSGEASPTRVASPPHTVLCAKIEKTSPKHGRADCLCACHIAARKERASSD